MGPSDSRGFQITHKEGPMLRAREIRLPLQLRMVGGSASVTLNKPRCTIGSGRDNDMVLRDRYVSRTHATLEWKMGRLWLQDEASRNGCKVNNLRVERCVVNPGARIVLGHTILQLASAVEYDTTLGLVGQHESMKRVFERITRLGATDNPVLITGETGTGKELTARALHNSSNCSMGNFEPLNCGAIPRDLAESEFFGHARGAYTGALRERKGAFERADEGTLFLDEIGELPMELQPKILRALEEGEIQRIGENSRRHVCPRIIAATNRDLLREAERGRFRLDLYHRLAVGVIHLPPLRERKDDIPLLAQHFLNQCRSSGVQYKVTRKALKQLRRHLWLGNVRELRNAIYRATTEGGPDLKPADFEFLSTPPSVDQEREGTVRYLGRRFEEIKQDVYARILTHHDGNRSAAAAALGVPKSTFFDQVKVMGLVE